MKKLIICLLILSASSVFAESAREVCEKAIDDLVEVSIGSGRTEGIISLSKFTEMSEESVNKFKLQQREFNKNIELLRSGIKERCL